MTKILVIEDAKDLRDDVVETLTLEGFITLGAENGVEGVAVARREMPDLIVCDIMMPELDGYGVLETLRSDPATAAIPFIFMTAKVERVSMRQGMALGADDYVTKPFMISELLESVRAQLKKRADLNEAVSRRMDELRQNIVTALPHELRTPLNTIIGFSDMLLSEAQRLKPDQVVAWADHINTAAQRLYRLIENYLYYARLYVTTQRGDLRTIDESLSDFSTILRSEAMRVAELYHRAQDLQLDVELAPNLRVGYSDTCKIIFEITDNAFKFSDSDTQVTVTGRLLDNQYELVVLDQGRGMSPEQINAVGAYMQYERWLHEQQGMGLGLAIVKLLCQSYSAEFFIENTGSGTKVVVSFPIE